MNTTDYNSSGDGASYEYVPDGETLLIQSDAKRVARLEAEVALIDSMIPGWSLVRVSLNEWRYFCDGSLDGGVTIANTWQGALL